MLTKYVTTNYNIYESDIGYTLQSVNFQQIHSNAKVTFEGSKTKHSKYIYQSSVSALFDNFGQLIINGKEYLKFCNTLISNKNCTACDLGCLGLITYQNKEPANSNFKLEAYGEDDWDGFINFQIKIVVTLYYK